MANRWIEATHEEAMQAKQQGARVRRIGGRLEVLRAEDVTSEGLISTPISELRDKLASVASDDRAVVEEASVQDDRQSAERIYTEWLERHGEEEG